LNDFEAINEQHALAFRHSVCAVHDPVCDACLGTPNPNLFAVCEQGRCVAADMREHPFGACASPSDCQLRYGSFCCESTCSGSAEQVTAIAKTQISAHQQAVCSPLAGACAECASQFPPGVVADCVSGQCLTTVAPSS
jgi:hypothetical protein